MATLDHRCICNHGKATRPRRSRIAIEFVCKPRQAARVSPYAWSLRAVSCHPQPTQSAVNLATSKPAQQTPDDLDQPQQQSRMSRRSLGALIPAAAAAVMALRDPIPAHADAPFITSSSGLRIQDIRWRPPCLSYRCPPTIRLSVAVADCKSCL